MCYGVSKALEPKIATDLRGDSVLELSVRGGVSLSSRFPIPFHSHHTLQTASQAKVMADLPPKYSEQAWNGLGNASTPCRSPFIASHASVNLPLTIKSSDLDRLPRPTRETAVPFPMGGRARQILFRPLRPRRDGTRSEREDLPAHPWSQLDGHQTLRCGNGWIS